MRDTTQKRRAVMMKFEEIVFTKEQLLELKEIIKNNIKKFKEKMENSPPNMKFSLEFSIKWEESELREVEERLKKL